MPESREAQVWRPPEILVQTRHALSHITNSGLVVEPDNPVETDYAPSHKIHQGPDIYYPIHTLAVNKASR